ncbi:nitrogen fixation protein NifR [Staphylococcus haemolyticus]|nr:nitrogen fixation protein NifR [Staphylococcus haemolyticus]PTK54046.1 nitrogen fixation protein NifR [Staphylococcus haemolyticus]RIO67002.1 nitrogen fixation protein NifR [Staphylococcus haemolyticus]
MKMRLNQAFFNSSHPCGGERSPNTKNHESILQAKQVGDGTPEERISIRNSTSKASWERMTNLKKILSHSPIHYNLLKIKKQGQRVSKLFS